MTATLASGETESAVSAELFSGEAAIMDWGPVGQMNVGTAGIVQAVLPGRHLDRMVSNRLHWLREFAYEGSKRFLDIAISVIAIIVLSPILVTAAVITKLYDGGPVFFSQQRIGKSGRGFRCLKFRTMVVNAESLQGELLDKNQHCDLRTFKMANDPRITRPGRLLRRFSVDELPQILNVLFGQMTIVGPRPPLPSEVARYNESDFRRLAVKPGLTCIWQVSGRSRLPFPEQVQMDVEYIHRRSLFLDLSLIIRTIPAVLSGDGAS